MKYVLALALTLTLCLGSLAPCQAQSLDSLEPGVPGMGYFGFKELLTENLGKTVVVNFWATWCPPCMREMAGLMELREKYGDELCLVGISLDYSSAVLADFLRKKPLNYPVYHARPNLAQQLRITSLPRTLLVDRNGDQVFDYNGYISKSHMDRWIQKAMRRP